MVVEIMVSELNLEGIGDNLISEMMEDGDFEYDFEISQELFDDFQNRNFKTTNYINILTFCAEQLIAKDAQGLLDKCVELFGANIVISIPTKIYKQLSTKERRIKHNRYTLEQAIRTWSLNKKTAYDLYGHINYWNVSNVTDMSHLFEYYSINVYINDWDVSNVTNMEEMFSQSDINSPLDKWDVSSVKNMSGMFMNSLFNQPIENWDVTSVTDMSFMFSESIFDCKLNNWDVSNVENMIFMFSGSKFNKPLNKWNVENVKEMDAMFYDSSYTYDYTMWKLHPDVNADYFQ